MNAQPSRLARRRLAVVAVLLGVVAAVPSVWAALEPEAALRLRVIASLAAHEVWAVGTDVQVVGSEVRVQGFVRSEAERRRVLEIASGVAGVGRVRDRLSLTAWPTALPGDDSAKVALLAASAD